MRGHLLAHLVCPGRHTLTSLITTNGKQFEDWSADYGLYSQQRVNPGAIFDHVRCQIEALQPPEQPLCVAIDDTILHKTGKTIPGTAYRKDPLSPPFGINLVWAQRMLQFSAAVPSRQQDVRMIPIGFDDASTPRNPGKKATPEQHQHYREVMKQRNLNALAVEGLHRLQQQRRDPDARTPALHVLVDGSYTNRKVLRHLPENTTLIGRIRKDAKLNAKPENQKPFGRRRIYGEALPTPEEVRQDESIPWQLVRARACGKDHLFRVKSLGSVRWRSAGAMDLRLVIIAPVSYRKRSGGKLLYRQPAYLICTDEDMPLEQIVQQYIWRWDIEVNHRDEKSLLGLGEAQVRNEHSVHSVPACAVASYAMLQLAAIHAYGWAAKPNVIPSPKWRDRSQDIRASTQDLVHELRRELWADAINPQHLTDFMAQPPQDKKCEKLTPVLLSCLLASTA